MVRTLKQIKSMHGHWFVSLGQQEHAFIGSALHFIPITWFTYVFAKIRRVPKCVQFAGCSLDPAPDLGGGLDPPPCSFV